MSSLLEKCKKAFAVFGPGLVTGASDDDPSGIATYSQAGATFGLTTLWTVFITFPLMASIQETCARIGMATTDGLTTVLKKSYPRALLYFILLLTVPAILLNIGADIAGMGAVANLIFPRISPLVFSIIFTIMLLVSIVFLSYKRIVAVLKYLCLTLLCYLIVPFFTHPHWGHVLRATFVPHIHFNKEYTGIIVAILGTTISPYLFFWQTTMQAEETKCATPNISKDKGHQSPRLRLGKRALTEMRIDVNFGMLLSNVVMFFIILAAATALSEHGISHIDTVDQAAKALEPVAGKWAYLLFAAGVIGTGFLSIPVLSGTISYMVSETFGWTGSLDEKYYRAKAFYAVIAVSLVIGLAVNYCGLSPMKALVYTAILYGITAPIMIGMLMHIANNKKIMGKYVNKPISNILGGLTFLLMTAAAVALLYFQFS